MSESLRFFRQGKQALAIALPFDLDALIGDWQTVRPQMIRSVPSGYSRDEWAYLIAFVERKHLWSVYEHSFGEPVSAVSIDALIRPRAHASVWLPSNVSLLGPLTLILLSLAGIPASFKASTRGTDLTATFLDFLKGAAPEGPLRRYARENVSLAQFDRDDPRNARMALEASVRIAFGSDAAVSDINKLPNRLDSVGFAFSDRQSEAWVDKAAVDDATVMSLIKVFAIYGQAGCTSPQRIVLIDGTEAGALALQLKLIELWPKVVRQLPAPHVASSNIMAQQWASAEGWRALRAPDSAAVILVGDYSLARVSGGMALPIVTATAEAACSNLPPNIQTIGHAVAEPRSAYWLELLARTPVKRFVPIAQMHHFGPVWDGYNYWEQLFEHVEVAY